MVDSTEKSRLEQIAELLQSHGVEFIVIGGQAEILLGGNRVTFDVDLCYRRTSSNLEKLAAALREISPTLRGAPPDLPFQIDARALVIRIKQHIGRPKDQQSLMQLLAIKRLRDETQSE